MAEIRDVDPVFFASLPDLEDDHENSDEQQDPGRAHNDPYDFLATSMPTSSMNMVRMIRNPRGSAILSRKATRGNTD